VSLTRYKTEGSRTLLTLESPDPLSEATVLWFAPEGGTATLEIAGQASEKLEAWGFAFQAVTATLHEGINATAQARG
jgi:hypothetical protein